MNNILCCILFCCTASSLVNADCPTYPGIINATFNKEDQCGDITIRCDAGFKMEQMTECVDGEWKYQEPICKPECGYSITNNTAVSIGYIDNKRKPTKIECDQLCKDNPRCTVTIFVETGECSLYSAPLISRYIDLDLDQCIEKCTQMEECLMLTHWAGASQECSLFNVTKNNLDLHESFTLKDGLDEGTVAEKLCL